MKKFKVYIRKAGNKRGVIRYVGAETIEDALELAFDLYICKRYTVDFADYAKLGADAKIEYLFEEAHHLVCIFTFDLSIRIPEDFYVDIKEDYSNKPVDAGYLSF